MSHASLLHTPSLEQSWLSCLGFFAHFFPFCWSELPPTFTRKHSTHLPLLSWNPASFPKTSCADTSERDSCLPLNSCSVLGIWHISWCLGQFTQCLGCLSARSMLQRIGTIQDISIGSATCFWAPDEKGSCRDHLGVHCSPTWSEQSPRALLALRTAL